MVGSISGQSSRNKTPPEAPEQSKALVTAENFMVAPRVEGKWFARLPFWGGSTAALALTGVGVATGAIVPFGIAAGVTFLTGLAISMYLASRSATRTRLNFLKYIEQSEAQAHRKFQMDHIRQTMTAHQQAFAGTAEDLAFSKMLARVAIKLSDMPPDTEEEMVENAVISGQARMSLDALFDWLVKEEDTIRLHGKSPEWVVRTVTEKASILKVTVSNEHIMRLIQTAMASGETFDTIRRAVRQHLPDENAYSSATRPGAA